MSMYYALQMPNACSEYGLGGGVKINGNVPARTAVDAARFPFYGVWGSYQRTTDPWRTPQVRGNADALI